MGLRTRIKSKGMKVANKVLKTLGRTESGAESVSAGQSTLQADGDTWNDVEHTEDTETGVGESFIVEETATEEDTMALEAELDEMKESLQADSEDVPAVEMGPESSHATEEEKGLPPMLEGPEIDAMRTEIIENIQTIFDPEIPVNIYELGLIYEVNVHEGNAINVIMTLTSPNCPAAQSLPLEVKVKAESVDGVASAEVDVVWDPVWGPHLMTEGARLELNL